MDDGIAGEKQVTQYYLKNGFCDPRTRGPYTVNQIGALLAVGSLKPQHLISEDGQSWARVGEVKGLESIQTERPSSEQVDTPETDSRATSEGTIKMSEKVRMFLLGVCLTLVVVCSFVLILWHVMDEGQGSRVPIAARDEHTIYPDEAVWERLGHVVSFFPDRNIQDSLPDAYRPYGVFRVVELDDGMAVVVGPKAKLPRGGPLSRIERLRDTLRD